MSRTFTKYAPTSALALQPEAFGMLVECDTEARKNEYLGDVAIVKVSGPLMAAPDCWLDSYADIRARFAEACASPAKRVVLVVNSPGGLVHDAFLTSRALRSMATTAGKDFVTFINEVGASSAYALASSAPFIGISETGIAGSIGTIKVRGDVTQMNKSAGIGITMITSGSRKAYGNPDLAMSDAELAAHQHGIDQMAGMFFKLVSEHRGLSVEQIQAMEAGVFVGSEAVSAGLCDQVCTLDSLLVSPPVVTGAQVTLTQVIEALTALAASDGEDKDKAAAMLAATAEASGSTDEDTSDEEQSDEASAASSDEEPSDEEKPSDDEEKPSEEEKPAASVVDAAAFAALQETVAKLTEQLAQKQGKPVVTTVKAAVAKNPEKSKLDRELDKAFGLDKSSEPSVSIKGNVITFR